MDVAVAATRSARRWRRRGLAVLRVLGTAAITSCCASTGVLHLARPDLWADVERGKSVPAQRTKPSLERHSA